ncbi:uncharacterized membrane-anchored protein YitT (DUF2179 family) [Balneicella halophila]|uniref:Uncharacterized membrane-anchored protein YitT (DUF2179 family) n=1 Tax=Balneicella halophila TaxID=1537566 RepID=A0A7L4UQ32_BALHA|nr:YitT family protein [Balneicella halophila]PVX51860.1 uncharacterized membrane-anchored protein YitT (DUF2179 family) [Balneicella halophila]
MSFTTKEKLFSLEWFQAYFFLIAGSIIFAASDILFVVPYKLAPGGVYGLATVLNTHFGWQINVSTISMEIPLIIIGTLILGPRFGVKTIVSIFIIWATVWLMENHLWPDYEKVILDPMLNALVAGVFYGISIGMIFKSRATSGGSDIIAMILSKYAKFSLGTLVMIVDGIIVLSVLTQLEPDGRLPWELVIYSLIIIFIEGKVIDMILGGATYHKAAMIVSDKYKEIALKIRQDLNRGATILTGEGAYGERKVVYTVMSRRELEILKLYIKETDPDAFVAINDANETLGRGFTSLNDNPQSS